MSRRKKDTGGGYSWMDTYGDLVTLLLTFFVLLYSFSVIDVAKFSAFQSSFSEGMPPRVVNALEAEDIIALNMQTESSPLSDNAGEGKDSSLDTPGVEEKITQMAEIQQQLENTVEYKRIEQEFNALLGGIERYIKKNGLTESLTISREGDEITILVTDVLLFDSAEAELLTDAQKVLLDLGTMLQEKIDSISMIRVEGHTDNRPIRNNKYDDNWDLAAKRATNAIRALNVQNEISEQKLSAVGYGEFKPIASNDTPEGRAKNRRVSFIIVKEDIIGEWMDAAGERIEEYEK